MKTEKIKHILKFIVLTVKFFVPFIKRFFQLIFIKNRKIKINLFENSESSNKNTLNVSKQIKIKLSVENVFFILIENQIVPIIKENFIYTFNIPTPNKEKLRVKIIGLFNSEIFEIKLKKSSAILKESKLFQHTHIKSLSRDLQKPEMKIYSLKNINTSFTNRSFNIKSNFSTVEGNMRQFKIQELDLKIKLNFSELENELLTRNNL